MVSGKSFPQCLSVSFLDSLCRPFLMSAGAAVTSVVSDSVRPHRRQPTRLPCSWDSPGKNTGVGCHFLLQCMKLKSESEVAQSCPTLSNPMDCSPPGSSAHGIFQARVLSSMYQSHNSLCVCVISCASAFLDVRGSFILIASLKCLAHSGRPRLVCLVSE